MPADPSDAELLALCSAIEHDINTAPDMPLMPSLDNVRVLIGAARRSVELDRYKAVVDGLLRLSEQYENLPHDADTGGMLVFALDLPRLHGLTNPDGTRRT